MSAPAQPTPPAAPAAPATASLCNGLRPALTATLLACLGLSLWASAAADPDFPLWDPFHGLVAACLGLAVAALWLPAGLARRLALSLAVLVPLVTMALEAALASGDGDQGATPIAAVDDPLLRYSYRPGAIAVRHARGRNERDEQRPISAEGLLDGPRPHAKPAGTVRVALLGDSVPNDGALPFAQRLPAMLEAALQRRAPAGRRVEVVNVSCEGYNTTQELRLFERAGLRYQPDVVVWTYVLNDPFLQNGAHRRVGNSYGLFRVLPALRAALGGSVCDVYAGLHTAHAFALVVGQSYERMAALATARRLPVLVAALPLVTDFADPVCLGLYDRVLAAAAAQGFATARVVDAFAGLDAAAFLKADDPSDHTHPNAAGIARIAEHLADRVVAMAWWGG